MYSSGTLTFVTCPFSGLISSARPSRTARQPSSTMDVSPPACPSNVEPAGGPPLHAAIHSAYTPCERGYFGCCAGARGGSPLATPCFAATRSFGSSPYVPAVRDRKSTRLNSSHSQISYAVFCLKKKKNNMHKTLQHA